MNTEHFTIEKIVKLLEGQGHLSKFIKNQNE